MVSDRDQSVTVFGPQRGGEQILVPVDHQVQKPLQAFNILLGNEDRGIGCDRLSESRPSLSDRRDTVGHQAEQTGHQEDADQ